MALRVFLLFSILLRSAVAIRINFTNCQQSEWFCVNNAPNDIVYSCSNVLSNDFIIHLKDYYTDHIKSVTVQNCRDIRVVLDCPILQRPSQLRQFKIKDCDRLEFITLSSNSLPQTPPEVTIENVREIVSFPSRLFKSPITNTELKCTGSSSLRKIHVVNSKINSINTNAIQNVSGIKSIEFENVTIANVQSKGIDALMGYDNTVFSILNSRIDKLDSNGITVQSTTVTIDQNTVGDIVGNAIDITSDHLHITENTFKRIYANGFILKSANTDITNNVVNTLKRGALLKIKCAEKRATRKQFNFSRNRIENVEPYSLVFDYPSCKSADTAVSFDNNKIDCKCRNIAFLNSATVNEELRALILDVANNNTCVSAPCPLPVEIVKLLLENDMCQLNLDPQVMCLLYNDKHSVNEVTTDEDITEPAPTFYLIRQANSQNGDASAAMTAIDRDDLLKDSRLNMTNRTIVKVMYNSSRDFVETLRSTSTTRKRPVEESQVPTSNEYVNRCEGRNCRTNTYNKQKALDFYKYVYAQLRSPRQIDNKENT